MTDARFRLIVLAVVLAILVATMSVMWIKGDPIPAGLEGIAATVLGVFVGHVYMNGTGGGSGGPGTPRPPTSGGT